MKYNGVQWSFEGDGRGITVYKSMRQMCYGNNSSGPEALIRDAAKKAKAPQVVAKGEAEMRAIGWWPKGIDAKRVSCGSTLTSWGGSSYVSHITAEYGGLIEGRPVDGPGLFYRITTIVTGLVDVAELRWAETRRYKHLKCKSVREAFEGLNRGHAQPLPIQCVGSKAKFAGVVYYMNKVPSSDHAHPFLKFRLTTPKGYSYDAYVPAIKGKYFKNPKRQVLIKELEEAKKKTKTGKTGVTRPPGGAKVPAGGAEDSRRK